MSTLIDRIDKLLIETIVVGGSYIAGTTINVIGSGQGRAVGDYSQEITVFQQKNPDNEPAIKFNKILGSYLPVEKELEIKPEAGIEPNEVGADDEFIG